MTRRFAPSAIALLLAAAALVSPPAVHAQGRGRPKTPHVPSAPTSTPTTPTTTSGSSSVSSVTVPEILAPAASFRQFGSWLEDASVLPRAEGFTSISVGHWRMAGATQTDVPMVAGGVGVSDRMQVSASVPFYQTSYQGTTSRGLDDVYLSAKYTIVDPTLTLSEFGLAVSPVVEVLSGVPGDRVHFAIPVSMEVRRQPYRIYASGGYFTRGSLFSGAAVEWTSARGLTLTGSLTQSYSTKADAVLDGMAVSPQRADVSGSVAYPLGNTVAASVSVGRSLTSIDQGGTKMAVSGGLSFRFTAAGARP